MRSSGRGGGTRRSGPPRLGRGRAAPRAARAATAARTERRARRRQGAGRRAPRRRAPRRRAARRRASAAAPPARAGARAQRGAPRGARARRPPPAAALGPGVAERRTLMLVTFLLVVYGLVMAYSASAAAGLLRVRQQLLLLRSARSLWVVARRGHHVGALARRLRLVPQGRRAARGPRRGRPRPRPRARRRHRHQRRPALDLSSAARACSPASSPSWPRRARRGAHRAAPAGGPDAARASCASR